MTIHDWEQILKDEGEDLLAPSVMRLLDTSIDSEETFKQFVKVVSNIYGDPGDRDAEMAAYRAAGCCDVATMNLVATHFGTADQMATLMTAFNRDYSVQTLRSFFVLMLTAQDGVPEDRAVASSLIVARSRSPHLRRKKHSLRTEEGLEGQKALTRLIRAFFGHKNRRMMDHVLDKSYSGDGAQFKKDELVLFVLENPGEVDRIAAVIRERDAVDMDLIRETLDTEAAALSTGIL